MNASIRRIARTAMAVSVVVSISASVGCHQGSPSVVRIANPTLGPMIVAVAPALNFSGAGDFDPNTVADIMASELSHVDGFEVLPVSRVLAVLAGTGLDRVESPAHARAVADALGVDAILIFAVTEYDPYDPPVVGLAAQLYGTRRGGVESGFDPVQESRRATATSERVVDGPDGLLASFSGVFNASHAPTIRAVQAYASIRDGGASPYGWRKYVVSQRHYLRFCCDATIRRMVLDGSVLVTAPAPPAG